MSSISYSPTPAKKQSSSSVLSKRHPATLNCLDLFWKYVLAPLLRNTWRCCGGDRCVQKVPCLGTKTRNKVDIYQLGCSTACLSSFSLYQAGVWLWYALSSSGASRYQTSRGGDWLMADYTTSHFCSPEEDEVCLFTRTKYLYLCFILHTSSGTKSRVGKWPRSRVRRLESESRTIRDISSNGMVIILRMENCFIPQQGAKEKPPLPQSPQHCYVEL